MSEHDEQGEEQADAGFVGGGGMAETLDPDDGDEADAHGDNLDSPEE
jgi:hypothetical protein